MTKCVCHWPVSRYQHSRCVYLLHHSRVAAFRHHDVTVPNYDIQVYLIDQRSSRYRGFLKPRGAATGCHRTLFTNTHSTTYSATFQVLTAVLLETSGIPVCDAVFVPDVSADY